MTAAATELPLPDGIALSAEGRACHGLIVHMAPEAITDELPDRLARHGLRLWVTDVPEPAARERLLREALRPVSARATPRAVLLRYADGSGHLVLTAHRRVPRTSLEEIAGLSPRSRASRVAPTEPPARWPVLGWGLGDPGRVGIVSALPLVLPPGVNAGSVLVAAAALALSRYSGDRAVEVSLHDEGAWRTLLVEVDEALTASAYLRRLASAEPTSAGGPALGVAIVDAVDGHDYLPFLAPPFPLTISGAVHTDGSFTGACWCAENVVSRQVAEQFSASVEHLAAGLADGADPMLSSLPLLDDAKAATVLDLGRTPATPRTPIRIDRLFRETARRHPDAIAVIDDDTTLTYRELDEQSDEVAAAVRGLGVGDDGRVGVHSGRSASLVVLLLGILKAGAAYVPMDLAWPADRLRYVAEDAALTLVVADSERFPRLPGMRVMTSADLLDFARNAPRADTEESADATAYVIYTSGSTGRPKGVLVPHRNVTALLHATAGEFGFGQHDVWTFFHSPAFDFSVWEIWGSLLTGGQLVVVPYWTARDTAAFHDLLARRGVTVLNQTPSAFAQLLAGHTEHEALSLRLLVFGGEPLDVRILRSWFARHSPSRCRVVNMYGITETTVHVTAQTVGPAEVVARSRSVGRALPGWSVSIRDERGRLLPPGPAGEIHVGGAGVADGYLGLPDLTGQRFVVDDQTGARWYRSGDLGRLRLDGGIEHLGRLDRQVKIRGHRIELDEIRAALLSVNGVKDALVLVRQEEPGDLASARIDAYVVVADPTDTSRVLEYTRRVLPGYMVPATVTEIVAVPLTSSGKPDLDRLPPPARHSVVRPTTTPDTDVATEIVDIWRRCLRTEVSVGDNFFELGGNSLLVVRAISMMTERGLPTITTRDFYSNSTAERLIRLVENRSHP